MAGAFKTQKKKVNKEKYYEMIDRQMRGHNAPIGRAPLVLLIAGESSTGKSGNAMDLVKYLNKNEIIVWVDLDQGTTENISEYYENYYNSDQIKRFNPIEWGARSVGQRETPLDYDKTLDNIRTIGRWLKETYSVEPNSISFKDENDTVKIVKAVVLDGVSKMKGWAENLMRIEHSLLLGDDPQRKFWRERKKEIVEVLELYKSIPTIDKVFIGNADCVKDKEKNLLDAAIDDLMSQIVKCEKEKTTSKTQFFATILKSRQNFRSLDRKIMFAEKSNDTPEKDWLWNTGKVLELLQSDKKPILSE
jgi:uridine kinase